MSEDVIGYVLLIAFPFVGTLMLYLIDRFVGFIEHLIREIHEFHEYEKAKSYWLDYDVSPEEFLDSKYDR